MARGDRDKHHLCPFWVGYLLASPIRTLIQNPGKILAPFVSPGMQVLEVGPAMGFFSLPLARLVGPSGRVVCVDLQEKMLRALVRRARRAGLADRIETRVCGAETLGVADLAGQTDFVLAFAVVHEVGDRARLFSEIRGVLKVGGRVLFAEPKTHVSGRGFEESLSAAERSGLRQVDSPKIARSYAVLLEASPLERA
ncbi:MAG: class I SAM-dependent methyltransferase [Candidatus Eisenbacteria bacterium]